jgi:hypothetical protein
MAHVLIAVSLLLPAALGLAALLLSGLLSGRDRGPGGPDAPRGPG